MERHNDRSLIPSDDGSQPHLIAADAYLVSECTQLLVLKSTGPSLCCYALACGPDVADTLQTFTRLVIHDILIG